MNKAFIALAVVVVVALGVWVMSRDGGEVAGPVPTPTPTASVSPVTSPTPSADGTTVSPTPSPSAGQQGNTVTYTKSGYSPSTITIKKGQTVTWVNDSSSNMWTASAIHPTHKLYPGTDITMCGEQHNMAMFDACGIISSGQSWSFKFDQTGTWKYHNHVNSAHTGTVVVE